MQLSCDRSGRRTGGKLLYQPSVVVRIHSSTSTASHATDLAVVLLSAPETSLHVASTRWSCGTGRTSGRHPSALGGPGLLGHASWGETGAQGDDDDQAARRSHSDRAGGTAAGLLEPGHRWSLARKREVTPPLLRGESQEALSRELGVELCRLGRRSRILARAVWQDPVRTLEPQSGRAAVLGADQKDVLLSVMPIDSTSRPVAISPYRWYPAEGSLNV